MKRIYIAGPYSTGDGIVDYLSNIRQGIEAAVQLIKNGYAVYCPFLDYQFAFVKDGNYLTKDNYQQNSLAWIEASDAIYLLPGWEKSKGTQVELQKARQLNIPCYDNMRLLLKNE